MRRWTPEEWQRAKAMLDQGVDRDVVAHAIGRAVGCLKEKIRWEGMSAEQRAARLKHIREKRQANDRAIRANKRQVSSGPYVSEEVLADRDARKVALEQRTITAQFFGDPPRTQSALYKKQMGDQAPA